MKVVIADDSKLSRSYIKRVLLVAGYPNEEIVEVANGKEALSIIESSSVRCLFLDINMPVMTGTELIEVLKEKSMINKINIVITSSLADKACIERLHGMGVKYFLRKPFSPEALAEIAGPLKGRAA